MPTSIAVRDAQKSDVRALSATLGRAFYEDPIMKWMLPDDRTRAKGLPRMFATLTRRQYLAGGGVEVATNGSDIGAATVWGPPPGEPKQSRLEELLLVPAFLWAFRGRARAAQEVAELMKKVHPEEPHWYLLAIGSDPTVRGAGFGQALMRSRLDRCDAEHAPAYLESTKQETVPYYMRFGFEVTGEIKLPDGGPSMFPMWRPAR
ncbi:MAG TPA: GNAT family N-acetyltransferase [Mycobacterium sp.]|nr:GNAT family N-acetyltransferase [Mycobacterium sp.]